MIIFLIICHNDAYHRMVISHKTVSLSVGLSIHLCILELFYDYCESYYLKVNHVEIMVEMCGHLSYGDISSVFFFKVLNIEYIHTIG